MYGINTEAYLLTIRSSQMRRTMLSLAFLITLLFEESKAKKSVPPGMNPDLFPTQTFDEEAPFCITEREPCGFYSFSLRGKAPFKWIKSWCQCSPTHDCVYDRPDMKMRVYRHNCMPKDAIKNRTQKQTTSVTHQRHNINGRHHTQQYHAHRRPAAELDTPRDLSAENEQQRQQSSTQPQQPYLKHKLQRPQMSEKQLTTLADVASTYLA